MSVFSAIEFSALTEESSEDEIDLFEVLDCILSEGWRIDLDGEVHWEELNPQGQWGPIRSQRSAGEAQDREFLRRLFIGQRALRVHLAWNQSNIQIVVGIVGNASRVIVEPSRERVRLKSSDRYTDFSWYLERLVRSLQGLPFGIDEIRCRDSE